jgi:hypothetical protein
MQRSLFGSSEGTGAEDVASVRLPRPSLVGTCDIISFVIALTPAALSFPVPILQDNIVLQEVAFLVGNMDSSAGGSCGTVDRSGGRFIPLVLLAPGRPAYRGSAAMGRDLTLLDVRSLVGHPFVRPLCFVCSFAAAVAPRLDLAP